MESRPPPRRIDRLALLFHAAMGLWFMASAVEALRQYLAADGAAVPAGTMLGTGLGLDVALLAWLGAGVVFLVLRVASRA